MDTVLLNTTTELETNKKLPSGKFFQSLKLKGKDARNFLRVMETQSKNITGISIMESLICQAITIENQVVTPEILDEIDFEDYLFLTRYIQENFSMLLEQQAS